MHNKGYPPSVETIKIALQNNSLYELFTGANLKQSTDTVTPANEEFIYDSWKLYVESQHDKASLWKTFMEIVVRISSDKDLSWFSFYYLLSFLESDRHKRIENINIQNFIDKVVQNVVGHKEKLQKDYRWTAYEKSGFSLWDDVKRLINNMSERYNFDFKRHDLRDHQI